MVGAMVLWQLLAPASQPATIHPVVQSSFSHYSSLLLLAEVACYCLLLLANNK
jgi:hypothetical protein